VASHSVGVDARSPGWVRVKARTTPAQPRGSEGDQAGRAADFIDSIDPKRTPQRAAELVRLVPAADLKLSLCAQSRVIPPQFSALLELEPKPTFAMVAAYVRLLTPKRMSVPRRDDHLTCSPQRNRKKPRFPPRRGFFF
jgi:hypothetical protein